MFIVYIYIHITRVLLRGVVNEVTNAIMIKLCWKSCNETNEKYHEKFCVIFRLISLL